MGFHSQIHKYDLFWLFFTQDLSYYCCIELQGEEDTLLASLSQLTSKEAGENTPNAIMLSLFNASRYDEYGLGLQQRIDKNLLLE